MIPSKKSIIEAGIAQHQAVIDDFRRRIKELMAADGNVNEEDYDPQVQSHKAEGIEEAGFLSEQLQFALRELEELRKISFSADTKHDAATLGSVVVTDKRIFFVSVSIESFEVDGTPVFGLSVQSPLFKSMSGKKTGESFQVQDVTYQITDIF
jgi:hypothetical protein